MPVLNIEGRKVQVDDSFLKLAPDEQQATVDEIASHFAPIEPLSVNAMARSAASGVPIVGGLLNKADAATNAALAPVLNPLFDPKDQLQGDTFGERYAKSLAMQNAGDTQFAAQHPYVDTGAKVAGAAASLAPAVMAAPGLFGAAGGLGTRVVAGGASNAALGAADAAVRGQDPLAAGGMGGLIGAALPVVGTALHGVASPFISNIMARVNPEAYGQRQAARGIIESGRSTADIAGDVTSAAGAGQPFTVADAMGNAGQRMLSTVARAPGLGRTETVNFLEGRQAGQGRRVSNALAEGFDAPETAAQTEARLTSARNTAADTEYGQVRTDANPVDVVDTINHLDRVIGTRPGQVLTPANDSVEAVLTPFRERLARVNPDDFEAVQRIRGDMADAAQSAMQGGHGNRARLIRNAVTELDRAMEQASPGYRAANANFAQNTRNIEAVQTGRAAATRGRTEDTIPRFQALQPEGQQAFRSGYVDPLIANTQGAAFGANKARPLINDTFQAEAGAMAPGNAAMQQRLAREHTMFETRQTALGGSKTADNLADADALGIDPSVVGHVIAGNWGGAIRSLIHAGSRALTGNTPQVRQAVARILLQHGANVTPAALDRMVGDTIRQIQLVQNIARGGSQLGALAIAPSQNNRRPARAPVFVSQPSARIAAQ
jgi:hypothetical protein